MTSRNLKFATVGQGTTDWWNGTDFNLNRIHDQLFPGYMDISSGLPANLPPGHAVCIGVGANGSTAYLAYANPTSGQSFRQRWIGMTVQRAPATEGDPVRIRCYGPVAYMHVDSFSYRSGAGTDSFGNGPQDTIPPFQGGHGRVGYLQDADPANEFTQGLIDINPGTRRIALGFYMSHKQFLLMPRMVPDLG